MDILFRIFLYKIGVLFYFFWGLYFLRYRTFLWCIYFLIRFRFLGGRIWRLELYFCNFIWSEKSINGYQYDCHYRQNRFTTNCTKRTKNSWKEKIPFHLGILWLRYTLSPLRFTAAPYSPPQWNGWFTSGFFICTFC